MKNILILGVARAGKSTLSRMIKCKYQNYNLLHTDSVRSAFLKLLPERYIAEFRDYENNVFFQDFLLEYFASQIRQSRGICNYIMEGAQILPKKVYENIDLNNTIIIFLGHGKLSAKEIFELCRKNDNELDYSYKKTDTELLEYAKDWEKKNELIKSECKKYGFKYVDTSIDRKNILNQIFKDICKEIEEE